MRLSIIARLAAGLIFTAPNIVLSIEIQSITLPDVDLSPLGQVAILGDFGGISVYRYAGQENATMPSSSKSDSLMIDLSPNLFFDISDSDGLIGSLCLLNNTVYIAGNFTRIGNKEIQSVASVDLDTGNVLGLGSGISGNVNAAYCDEDSDLVYFGGSFTKNVAIWNTTAVSWETVPFNGLSGGPVNAIVKRDGKIVFGGRFDGIEDSTSTLTEANIERQLQLVNIRSANVSAVGSSSSSYYGNPESIVCPANVSRERTSWLVEDGQQGVWTASFPYDIQPTRMRLYNAIADGRGTRLFRFVAHPINGILNLTYTDPETGDKAYCDAWCPLSNITTADYQDFEFVNDISINGFSVYLLDYYGQGAGLSGIQLYQQRIMTYAVAEYNEPASCGISRKEISASRVVGEWEHTTINGVSYLSTAELSGAELLMHYVSFYPDITVSGNYTVILYTPGCVADDSCDTRGMVNVTTFATSDGEEESSIIYQTNDYDKYDIIFQGSVDAIDEEFRPSVRLVPLSSQTGQITVVAQSAQFVLTSTSGGLNGLFEYDPSNYTVAESGNVYETAINQAGLMLEDRAEVRAMVIANSSLYVAGNFADGSSIHNILAIDTAGNITSLVRGLNGRVSSLIVSEDKTSVIAVGDFSGSSAGSNVDLSYIASWSDSASKWSNFDGGVNGPVENVVRTTLSLSGTNVSTLIFTGSFTEVNAANDEEALSSPGCALWIENEHTWADRTDLALPYLTGSLSASVAATDGTYILAGSVVSQSLGTSGAVILSNGFELNSLPFEFASGDETSSQRRAIFPVGVYKSSDVVYTGTFYANDSTTYLVAGGDFSATSGESIYKNFMILSDGGAIGGFTQDVFQESTVVCSIHNCFNTSLIIGGAFNGVVNDTYVNGVAIWDLASKAFSNRQPPALGGENVQVNVIAARPNTHSVVVAGSFTSAGNMTCENVCIYDMDSGIWDSVTEGISGNISSVYFLNSNNMIVGGAMHTVDTVNCYIAAYNLGTMSWNTLGMQSMTLPGPVSAFLSTSDSVDDAIVAGTYPDGDTSYLSAYRSGSWHTLSQGLNNGSLISTIELLPLGSRATRQSSILPDDMILLVLGNLRLAEYGNVSAAFHDGDGWLPFLYTIKSDGSPGTVHMVMTEHENAVPSIAGMTIKEKLPMRAGFVVLISLAISLAIMFIIVGVGMLAAFYRRRSEGYELFSPTADESMTQTLPPSALFGDMTMTKS
ncbi:cortical protein marker for cell polarity-domain-containing protein [Lipomyces arxii]|uniref:cortical protein marker for cell polarity-domain-containing protein n=1 Tax=Lipomyces arxii TaxID=56418 RepID=UPI0034CF1F84